MKRWPHRGWFRRRDNASSTAIASASITPAELFFAQKLRAGCDSENQKEVATLLRQLADVFEDKRPSLIKPPTYIVSNRLMREAYKNFFQESYSRFCEQLHFVAGFQVDDFILWDHLVSLDYQKQSAVGVLVKPASCYEALDSIRARGMFLVGHIHSHPGSGPSANHPSSIDERFVTRLANGGSAALGAIMCRGHNHESAFVRFYAAEEFGPFAVTIGGNSVEQLDDHNGHNYGINLTALANNESCSACDRRLGK